MSVNEGDIQSTWATRELPILRAALRRLEAGNLVAEFNDIEEETGLSQADLIIGVTALESADPPYVAAFIRYGGHIAMISERARRELGAWPSASNVIDDLIAALTQAANQESEPEQKSRFRAVADTLGGAARDVAVSAVASRLGG